MLLVVNKHGPINVKHAKHDTHEVGHLQFHHIDPHPPTTSARSRGSQISKNAINLEQIEII